MVLITRNGAERCPFCRAAAEARGWAVNEDFAAKGASWCMCRTAALKLRASVLRLAPPRLASRSRPVAATCEGIPKLGREDVEKYVRFEEQSTAS